MEAIIKAKDIKTFQAVIDFLKSLNFDVTITDQAISKKQFKRKKTSERNEEVQLNSLIGLYTSNITDGSVNHDKEIYAGKNLY